MVKSHKMDLLEGCVRNSGGHIITYFKEYFQLMDFYSVIWYIDIIQ